LSTFKKTYQPAYLNLKEKLKSAIKSGELKPGERIASNKELSKKFNISQVTVRQALLALDREGYVNIVPRVGSYVADRGKQISPQEKSNIIALLVPAIFLTS